MIWAVLPVKCPAESMQRLNDVLTPGERETLALTMYEEMLAKLLAAENLDAVAVASSDRSVLDYAGWSGARILREDRQSSHSRSADWAAAESLTLGARTVVLAPIDVPLATTAEIENLVRIGKKLGPRGLVVVPSENGDGTNALVRRPPDAIESRFGPGSFEAHVQQARQCELSLRVVRTPGLQFDIDTPADMLSFFRRAKDGPTLDYLRYIGAEERAERFCRGNPNTVPSHER